MIKGQSKYIRKKQNKIWDSTFGSINPLLKGQLESIQGKWEGGTCLDDSKPAFYKEKKAK